ncbi:hypothetical protein EVJ30_13905 [Exiguobacterium sp. SH5S13]|uniref:hypothetical protein n=1 Tax=unclassified Exiguobacterium TaxID=2644629 RepID=UPI00103C615E|nr:MULTISPECIES: hypothetical protein [unclassified Exiguobacterium]TCI24837.1 hypothetical protein EVJ32_12740 [Exiguobacterium sp. SH5S4]TCI49930.1 hypothetical protein EVJ30_13905 [Exiguobacterium sp. SH5S13]
MIINYQLTYEDIIALQKDYLNKTRSRRQKKTTLIIATIFIVYWIGLFLASLLFKPTSSTSSFYDILPILGAFGGVLFIVLMMPAISKISDFVRLLIYRFVLKKDNSFPRDLILHFQETGIEIHSINNQIKKITKVSWKSIERLGNDKTRLFLYYLESKEGVIVPISDARISKAEKQKLRDLLNQYLSSDIIAANNRHGQFLS